MSHNTTSPMAQQIAAIRKRTPQAYLLLPVKPHQEPRYVFAYPTKHEVGGVHYRDIFIPGSPHEGDRTVRADRLRRAGDK